MYNVALAAVLGLVTTSSSMLGAALGLHPHFSKRVLAGTLAFAAGSLIAALAIELAFESAQNLHVHGSEPRLAWAFVAGGFAIGAVIYYSASLALETRGGAVRYPTRFLEYARECKQRDTRQLIELLSKCDLLRHLPPEEVERILPFVQVRELKAGEVLFRAGDPGDALYIIEQGRVAVLAPTPAAASTPAAPIAELSEGETFGEMALLSRGPRTATVSAVTDTKLLLIGREDFARLVATDPQLAHAVERLSHGRAIRNLSLGGGNPAVWAKLATMSLDHVSASEATKLLSEAGTGSGLAIVFGNILDTIPGCLVIGAKFNGFADLSLTLMIGMFIGGIPEAAASAAMLRKAGYRPNAIFGLWSTVLVAGFVAAAAGKMLIGDPSSLTAIFCQALAGGAVLALITHAMIPEALHEGGSVVVLPTVAGFLFAFYLSFIQTAG
jgi:CRP-like cAMP-binding protein